MLPFEQQSEETQAQQAALSEEALRREITVSEAPILEKGETYTLAAPDASQEKIKKPMKAPMKMQMMIYPL